VDPEIFEKPGSYKLQFILYGGTKPLLANEVEISIESPRGIDKEAYDFLKVKGKDNWFGEVFTEKINSKVLMTFVDRYQDSTYGEPAVASLGRYFSHHGELEKAKIEFAKLESSANNFLVKRSKKDIAEIERKLKERSQ